MELMPFNFDRLPNGRVFISNLAGFHHFINEQELLDLSDEQISAEQSNPLESKLFITNESSSAIAPYALSSAFAKRLMNELAIRPIFMIVPTLRCDHTCKYCQVSRASVNASGYDLDPDLIPHIISTIKKLSIPPYKIEIQGGEPLLRFDLIQSICKHPCFSSMHFLRVPVFQPSAGTLPVSGYSGIHEAARCYIPSASAR